MFCTGNRSKTEPPAKPSASQWRNSSSKSSTVVIGPPKTRHTREGIQLPGNAQHFVQPGDGLLQLISLLADVSDLPGEAGASQDHRVHASCREPAHGVVLESESECKQSGSAASSSIAGFRFQAHALRLRETPRNLPSTKPMAGQFTTPSTPSFFNRAKAPARSRVGSAETRRQQPEDSQIAAEPALRGASKSAGWHWQRAGIRPASQLPRFDTRWH